MLVASPELSDWTSHRAYYGSEPAPSWLNVKLGLELCGFESNEKGRQQFHEFVCARITDPKNAAFSGRDSIDMRRKVRTDTTSLLELAGGDGRGRDGLPTICQRIKIGC
jgi:hypothetical protein